MPLKNSKLVYKVAQKAFKECDLDGDGVVDAKELHVGMLLVYDKLNDVLPVHLKPPPHKKILRLLARHDTDGTGTLGFEEFYQCVRTLVGVSEDCPVRDSLPFAIMARIALKMTIFPALALAAKRGLVKIGGERAEKIPDGLLVVGVEGLYKIAKLALDER